MAQQIKFYSKPPKVGPVSKQEFDKNNNEENLRAGAEFNDDFNLDYNFQNLVEFKAKRVSALVSGAEPVNYNISYTVSFDFSIENPDGPENQQIHKVNVTVKREN